MDRRSWLWRRKSSEKSPNGETESSGSLSSHSERFSDDQSLANQNMQSPEVTSKSVPGDEDRSDCLKTMSERLSEVLLDVRTKEDLVKQHAKVAEEAVTGIISSLASSLSCAFAACICRGRSGNLKGKSLRNKGLAGGGCQDVLGAKKKRMVTRTCVSS